VLPDFEGHDHEGAHTVLFRIANYIDELLVRFYRLEPYYKLKSPRDLVGHLVMALAPHTSAAIACRIVGFSQTQGFFAHPYIHSATRRDCDGDESGVLLLMDAFLNFSKHFLPNKNGGTMDAPLVLTSILLPTEVDDMAFDVDIAWKYPLELYEAALEMKMPWDVPIRQIKQVLGTPDQYENQGFTHDTDSINNTVTFSAYKTLPSMKDKLWGQMALSERLRAVKAADVAALVIDKHFMKDTKGNLRKFSQQEFRCVNCNTKFRRPPLSGKCNSCTRGKILFTINEGGIVKYLEPMVSLVTKYDVPPYLRQTVELLQQRVEGVFGREKEKQSGLGDWF
jgi:DNA polymerase II large subunit